MFCEPRSRLLLSADHVVCVPVPVSATAASSPLDWTVSVPDSSPGVGGGVKVTWTGQNSFWARTVGTGLALQSPSWGSTPKAALSVETASIVTELASVFVIVTGWAVVVPPPTSCGNGGLGGWAVGEVAAGAGAAATSPATSTPRQSNPQRLVRLVNRASPSIACGRN